MTLRIPILEQDIRASFAPMGPVDAVQVADPRGKALQGLGDALGQVGDTVAKAQAKQPHPATDFKYEQDSRAWTMQTYAQCVSQAADLGTQLTSQGPDGVDAPAGNLFDALRMPTLQQAFGGALPAFGGASPSGSSASGPSPEPSPTDVATHGLTGAWVNGYDLIAQRGVSAASDPAVAQRIADQCRLDRASGRMNIMSYEALRNVQQREDGYLASVQTVADKRLTADPAALGEMLAFAKANMIRVDPHRQAGFEAKVDNILIDAAMQTAISRDPRGLVLALEHRAGVKEAQGSDASNHASGNAEGVSPALEGHLAEHPVTSALTPEQAQAWLPRANAALETARSTARVATLQASDTALREYRDTGSAAHAPDEAQLIGTLGLARGQQVYAQLQEARSEGNHYVNLRSLSNAALLDMRAQESEEETAQSAPSSPAQRAIDRLLRERQSDPMQAALDAGGYGLNALDLSNAQAAQQGVLARITPSQEVAGNYGGRRGLLAGAESPKLAGVIQALPPREQAQWLRDLITGAGDNDAVQSVLRQLSPHAPALAQAGRLLLEDRARNGAEGEVINRTWGGSGEIDAATQILNGSARIRAGDASLPSDAEMRRAFYLSMGGAFADQPGEEAMRYEAMRAAYAGLSEREGDASGKFDQRRWEAAVKLVSFGSGTAREVGLAENETKESVSQAALAQMGENIGYPEQVPPEMSDQEASESKVDLVNKRLLEVEASNNLTADPVSLNELSSQFGDSTISIARKIALSGGNPDEMKSIKDQLGEELAAVGTASNRNDQSQDLAKSIERAYGWAPGTLSVAIDASAALEANLYPTFASILPGSQVHEPMSVEAGNKIFGRLARSEADALATGVAWPDAPCPIKDYVGICSVGTITALKIVPKLLPESMGEKTLPYQSHLGSLQFWHSMAPKGVWTNGQVLRKILGQSELWYGEAKQHLQKGNRILGFFNFGKLLHMVQDSFAGAHVARDEDGRVLLFQGYDKQDPKQHATGDDIPKYGKWRDIAGAQKAYDVTLVLMDMFKQGAPAKDVVEYLKEKVYPLHSGVEDQIAGGTLQQYVKKAKEQKGTR